MKIPQYINASVRFSPGLSEFARKKEEWEHLIDLFVCCSPLLSPHFTSPTENHLYLILKENFTLRQTTGGITDPTFSHLSDIYICNLLLFPVYSLLQDIFLKTKNRLEGE